MEITLNSTLREILRTRPLANWAFEAKLVDHADLESNMLFPMDGRLEQVLSQNAAPGIFRYPAKG